jgi:glyceraldehyde-3-phosphate dehydrogenase (NAD(P))
MTVRVGLNGYGVIGKRVADAVALQDDMELVGVADITNDYRIRVAVERGYTIFSSISDKVDEMRDAGIPVEGDLRDLLNKVDVIVDATPKRIGAKNKETYAEAGVKAIFQGGEKPDVAEVSFNALADYERALNKTFARVVSCNTTALCRVMSVLHGHGWVKRARVVLMRRGTDPWESHIDGIINSVIPQKEVPTHQGPDAQTVIPDLSITTMAGSGPWNLSHVHYAMIETPSKVDLDEVRNALWEAPRIAFVHSENGLVALNSVIELMRDIGRMRNDMWEVAVWESSMAADDTDLYLIYQVHNEAITIPENVDCIRALTGIETDGMKSIEKTDRSLGIMKHSFLMKTIPEPQLTGNMGEAAVLHSKEGHKGSEEPISTMVAKV